MTALNPKKFEEWREDARLAAEGSALATAALRDEALESIPALIAEVERLQGEHAGKEETIVLACKRTQHLESLLREVHAGVKSAQHTMLLVPENEYAFSTLRALNRKLAEEGS